MEVLLFVVLIFLSCLGLIVLPVLLVLLLVRDTARQRGQWGINPRLPCCPACGEKAPLVRLPRNFRQAMWGGFTCARCGVEYDKWGQAVTEGDARDGELERGPDAPSHPQPPSPKAD